LSQGREKKDARGLKKKRKKGAPCPPPPSPYKGAVSLSRSNAFHDSMERPPFPCASRWLYTVTVSLSGKAVLVDILCPRDLLHINVSSSKSAFSIKLPTRERNALSFRAYPPLPCSSKVDREPVFRFDKEKNGNKGSFQFLVIEFVHNEPSLKLRSQSIKNPECYHGFQAAAGSSRIPDTQDIFHHSG
jgi:hypothetical protein